jgi:hypothetical protein
MPPQGRVLADQQVGKTVAGQVDEAELGTSPVHVRHGAERAEVRPVGIVGSLEVAGTGPVESNGRQPAVTREVHQLDIAAAQPARRRLASDALQGAESRHGDRLTDTRLQIGRTQVRLVVPAPALFGQNTGDAFAIQVDPARLRARQPVRQIAEDVGVDVAQRLVDRGLGVLELDWRQRTRQVARALADIPGLRGGQQIRIERLRRVYRRCRCMPKVGRANEAIESHRRFGGEMVEHQDAPAQAVRSDLEAGAIAGERIEAARPWRRRVRRQRCRQVVLAVVEDELEAPVARLRDGLRRGEVGKVGRPVAVEHALDVALRRSRDVGAVALVHRRSIDTSRVLRLVLVDDDVALVVVGLADQP